VLFRSKREVKLFHNIVNPLMHGPTVQVGGSIMPTIWYLKIIYIYNLKVTETVTQYCINHTNATHNTQT
jgi:tRNA(Ile2) C34 agmatinyltransferase TiaS